MARLTLRERIFGRVEERTLRQPTTDGTLLPSAGAPISSLSASNPLAIADAYACVRALSDAAASLPLIAYRRRDEGRQRLKGGQIVRLLDKPAPSLTQASLIGSMVAHLNLHGNAYLGKYRGDGVAVEQIALLNPERVRPKLVAGEPRFEVTDEKGRRTIHTSEDVVHVKGLSTDGLVGLAPVKQARAILGLAESLTTHATSFFENDASPRGLLKLNRVGDVEEQTERIREAWNTRHKGASNASRIAVVKGDIDFEAVSMPLDDAQFLEQRKLSTVEVARIFRVPPWMVGADSGESMTYSNVESQALAFVTYSLRPWLVQIEQAISADSDLCSERVYVEFLLDALLRADSLTRAQVYTAALNPATGWMNRDEVRRLENLEPEPEESLRPAPTAPAVAPPMQQPEAGPEGNGAAPAGASMSGSG